MLVLRKEIKTGLCVGGAVLGIASVYGLMALLSAGNGSQQASAPADGSAITATDGAGKSLSPEIRTGLPPRAESRDPVPGVKEEPIAKGRLDVPTGSASNGQGNDPFASPNHDDAGKSDPWAAAFSTGKIALASAPSEDRSKPILINVPTGKGSADKSSLDKSEPNDTKTSSRTPGVNPMTTLASSSGKYVIKSGDTFSSIAAEKYGSKRFVSALLAANPNIDPRRLRPGIEINLPDKSSSSVRGSAEPARVMIAEPIDASRQYRVEPGDTLSRIAGKLYKNPNQWQALYEANKQLIGPDESKLKIGTVLTLPQR